jgi:KDO2-lipid IV(A) lauroyltransferase
MAKRGPLQTRLEYAIARVLLAGLGILPRRLALTVGRGLGRVGYFVCGGLRKTGRRNLDIAFPDLDAKQKQLLLRGTFDSLGRLLGMFSQLPAITADELRQIVRCEGLDHLRVAQAGGSGVIVFTAHLGAWELTSFTVGALVNPFSFLVRRLDNELIEGLIDKVRQRFGNRTLDKNAVSREALRQLKEGGMLGMLPDVNVLARDGVFVDFFGTPASTTSMLAKLSLRTGAPVIPVYAPWDEQRQQYRLEIEPPLVFERTGDETQDVHNLTAALMASVENVVRRYPEQWLWIHRRWKTRPPGEPGLY